MNRGGMNLAPTADFSSDTPFVDVFRQSRPWKSQQTGHSDGQGPPLTFDADGYPLSFQGADCWASTILQAGVDTYALLWDGTGTWQLNPGTTTGTIVVNSPGNATMTVTSTDPISLRLLTTDPANHVRNVRCLSTAPAIGQWNAAFIGRLRALGVKCLRFMDWGGTNNSTQVNWTDRTTPTSQTWSAYPLGTNHCVPLEVQVDLCNVLGVDGWFCLPAKCTDDYATHYFAYIAANLNSGLKAYFEYSNEVWNSFDFSQYHYCLAQGVALGFGHGGADSEEEYYAYRAGQLWALCDAQFGGSARTRTVRVIASQAGNAGITDKVCGYLLAHGYQADVIAIAPYIGFSPKTAASGPGGIVPPYTTVKTWTPAEVLDFLTTNEMPIVQGWLTSQLAMSVKYDLPLVAYEGGQGIEGGDGAAQADATLTDLFKATNADAGMGTLYTAYLAMWDATLGVGHLFNHFNSCQPWGPAGYWGLVPDLNTATPKQAAWINWANTMSLTLAISDNRDGTGAVATVSGSDSGSTNNVYAAIFGGQTGALTWALVGTRTGDGTVAVSLPVGYYVWTVLTTSAGVTTQGNAVWQNLSNTAIESPHYQCLVAIQTRLQGLNLEGIGSNVLVKWLPRDLEKVDTLPAIIVAPVGKEGQGPGLNNHDDIDYPCLVAIIDAQNKDYTANLARDLYWRWRVFQSPRHQRLAGVPNVMTVSITPDYVVNPMLFDKNRFYSALLFMCRNRETRG